MYYIHYFFFADKNYKRVKISKFLFYNFNKIDKLNIYNKYLLNF